MLAAEHASANTTVDAANALSCHMAEVCRLPGVRTSRAGPGGDDAVRRAASPLAFRHQHPDRRAVQIRLEAESALRVAETRGPVRTRQPAPPARRPLRIASSGPPARRPAGPLWQPAGSSIRAPTRAGRACRLRGAHAVGHVVTTTRRGAGYQSEVSEWRAVARRSQASGCCPAPKANDYCAAHRSLRTQTAALRPSFATALPCSQ